MKINTAVARSIDILTFLAENKKPMTLSEISKNVGIPKSSALDIMYTLVEKGMVEVANEEFKTYQLGLYCFHLGTEAVNRNDLQKTAARYLVELSEATGKTVFLSVPRGERVVYVSKIEGSSPVQSACPIGSTNPMYVTGIGKAILAGMSDEEIIKLYGEGPYERRTQRTLGNYEELIEDIRMTRERGYSIDNREGNDYIFCFGAPVYDYTNKVVAGISVVSLVEELTHEDMKTYPDKLKASALEISRKMGYSGQKFYTEVK